IEETTEVATERIILSQRRNSFTLQRVSLVTDDPLIRVEPQSVQVTIVVLPVLEETEEEDEAAEAVGEN
ncbi:MAG: hypothetical protein R3338_13740, partial [Thermoanaerobaculia bacterium]|nr:hypothetical protein [Thermoanaerobaculia bacterium]